MDDVMELLGDFDSSLTTSLAISSLNIDTQGSPILALPNRLMVVPHARLHKLMHAMLPMRAGR